MKETRFKQTEIGPIPEDWKISKLGSIFKFIPNNTISRDNLVEQGVIMNVHYGDILIKYDSILDIEENNIPFINENVIGDCRFNEFAKDGDILIADTAEDEMVCKATELHNIKNRKLVSGLHTMWIRPVIEFKSKYLGYFFNSTFYHNQILPLIQGTKVCSVSKGAIKDTCICIPLENEQKKIASALTAIDNLLLSLEKLIEKKRLIKQGTMQELLTGKKRLPGFTGEWVEKLLGEITEMNSGGTPSVNVKEYYGNEIPFLSISDMSWQGKYLRKTEKSITYLGLKNSSARIFPCGTILYAMYASIGKCSIAKIELAISQAVLGIKVNKDVLNNIYLYYHLSFIENKAKKIGQQGTQSNLSKEIVEKFKILLPSLQEQKAIAAVLSSMDREIESLEGKKAKYEQIKQGMMQQLLTGKIRLI